MSNPATRVDVPVIDGLQGKVGVIERRIEYLQRRLGRDGYKASNSADFDEAEVSALQAAIAAMRYVAEARRHARGG